MEKWHAVRAAKLKALAEEAGKDIDVLVLLDSNSIASMIARFGKPYGFVAAHRADPELRAARVAAYASSLGAEDCPKCWVRYGTHSPLEINAAYERQDLVDCGQCNFSELLPNKD